MARSRVLFLVIIGLAAVFVVVVIGLQGLQKSNDTAEATKAFQATQTAIPVVGENNVPIVPIFAGGQTPTDSLPKYVCEADAFASYYGLEQMQVAGYDVKNGFHLGIVPFYLDSPGSYDINEDARNNLLSSGKVDCLFTTLDSTALSGAGVITAVVDESAGVDQLWARPDVKELNDLKGKKILYVSESVGQFFALYGLAVAGIQQNQVTMLPADSVQEAVKRFNNGEADAVSGYEPDILKASSSGQYLIGSDKLHVIVDVIMTSKTTISSNPGLVQRFHDAWFQTLKAQFEDLPGAAKQIAAWGHNDWSGINTATAEADFKTQIAKIAQAGLTQNLTVMKDTSRLIDRLDAAKRVWSAAGEQVYAGKTEELVKADFVLKSGTRNDLSTSATPPNTSFLLASTPNFAELAPDAVSQTLAVLPCRKFAFGPEGTDLLGESKQILDSCVLPVLKSSVGIYLQIVGSAAWPANDPPFKEADITSVAAARAKAVEDYLVQNGIDPRRFKVSTRLPAPDHQNTTDVSKQSDDRYVELTLITVGR